MTTRIIDDSPEFNQDEAAPSTELATKRESAQAIAEVQGAIVIAKRFPRSEDNARAMLLRACKRPGFAEEAEYTFPRGQNQVSGPSVALAREAARVWGNIQWGFTIIAEDDAWRTIRSFAWDVETNSKPVQDDRFRKLIQRKVKGGGVEWVRPDERDLRELTNRRAAIGYRNCVLQVIPKDLIDEAVAESRATLRDRAAKDPDGERKRICDAFAQDLNVMPAMLEQILGHAMSSASPIEIADLRGIYRSIRDGNSRISDYVSMAAGDERTAAKSSERLEEIKARHADAGKIDPEVQKRRDDLKAQTAAIKNGIARPAGVSTKAVLDSREHETEVMSVCKKHGDYVGDGNCPACEKEAGR